MTYTYGRIHYGRPITFTERLKVANGMNTLVTTTTLATSIMGNDVASRTNGTPSAWTTRMTSARERSFLTNYFDRKNEVSHVVRLIFLGMVTFRVIK